MSAAGRGLLLISQRDWLSGRRTIGFGLYPLRALPRCKARVGRLAKAFWLLTVPSLVAFFSLFFLRNLCAVRPIYPHIHVILSKAHSRKGSTNIGVN